MSDDTPRDPAPADEAAETPVETGCEFPIGPRTPDHTDGQHCGRVIPDVPGKRGPKGKYCGLDGHLRQAVFKARVKHGLVTSPMAEIDPVAAKERPITTAQDQHGPAMATVAELIEQQLRPVVDRIVGAIEHTTTLELQMGDREDAALEVAKAHKAKAAEVAAAERKVTETEQEKIRLQRAITKERELREDAELAAADALAKEQRALELVEQTRTDATEQIEQIRTEAAAELAAEVARVTSEAEADVNAAREREAAAIADKNNTIAETAQQIAEIREQADREITAVQVTADQQVRDARDAAEQAKTDAGAKVEQAQAQAERAIQQAKDEAQRQIEQAKTDAQTAIAGAREEAQTRVRAAQASAAEQVQEAERLIEAARGAEITAYRELEQARDAAARDQASADAARGELTRIRADLERLQHRFDEAEQQHRDDVAAARAELVRERDARDADRATHNEQITRLTQALTTQRPAPAESAEQEQQPRKAT